MDTDTDTDTTGPDKGALRKRLEAKMTEKTTVFRAMPFDADDLREAFALLGKRFATPLDARLVVRLDSRADDGEAEGSAVAVFDDGVHDEGDKHAGVVLGFEFTWSEARVPKERASKD